MAQASTVSLASYASLAASYNSTAALFYPNVELPFTNSTIGRVVYVKQAGNTPGPSVMSVQPSTSGFIQTSTLLYLSACQCLMLQAFSTNNWGILGAYTGLNVFSTQVEPAPGSVIVNPTMKTTNLFVDLTSQSKTVVLPPIRTITPASSMSAFYTIKDIAGNAATNFLYISTSENDRLENSDIRNSIKISQNYASIDLAANLPYQKWHILNYYNGSLS